MEEHWEHIQQALQQEEEYIKPFPPTTTSTSCTSSDDSDSDSEGLMLSVSRAAFDAAEERAAEENTQLQGVRGAYGGRAEARERDKEWALEREMRGAGGAHFSAVLGQEVMSIPFGFSFVRRLRDPQQRELHHVAYNPEEDSFAIMDNACIHVYKGPREIKRMQFQNLRRLHHFVWLPDHEVYVGAASDNHLRVFSWRFHLLNSFPTNYAQIYRLSYNPARSELIGVGHKGLYVWRVTRAATVLHQAFVSLKQTAFVPSDSVRHVTHLAHSATTYTIYAVWDAHIAVLEPSLASIERTSHNLHSRAISGVIVHPSSEILITSSLDGTIKVWSLSLFLLHVIDGHRAGVSQISLNPVNSDLLLSTSLDHSLRVWDLNSYSQLYRLDMPFPILGGAFVALSRFYYRGANHIDLWSMAQSFQHFRVTKSPVLSVLRTPCSSGPARILYHTLDGTLGLSDLHGNVITSIIPQLSFCTITDFAYNRDAEFLVVLLDGSASSDGDPPPGGPPHGDRAGSSSAGSGAAGSGANSEPQLDASTLFSTVGGGGGADAGPGAGAGTSANASASSGKKIMHAQASDVLFRSKRYAVSRAFGSVERFATVGKLAHRKQREIHIFSTSTAPAYHVQSWTNHGRDMAFRSEICDEELSTMTLVPLKARKDAFRKSATNVTNYDLQADVRRLPDYYVVGGTKSGTLVIADLLRNGDIVRRMPAFSSGVVLFLDYHTPLDAVVYHNGADAFVGIVEFSYSSFARIVPGILVLTKVSFAIPGVALSSTRLTPRALTFGFSNGMISVWGFTSDAPLMSPGEDIPVLMRVNAEGVGDSGSVRSKYPVVDADYHPMWQMIVSVTQEGHVIVFDTDNTILGEVSVEKKVTSACFCNQNGDILLGVSDAIIILHRDVYFLSRVDVSEILDLGHARMHPWLPSVLETCADYAHDDQEDKAEALATGSAENTQWIRVWPKYALEDALQVGGSSMDPSLRAKLEQELKQDAIPTLPSIQELRHQHSATSGTGWVGRLRSDNATFAETKARFLSLPSSASLTNFARLQVMLAPAPPPSASASDVLSDIHSGSHSQNVSPSASFMQEYEISMINDSFVAVMDSDDEDDDDDDSSFASDASDASDDTVRLNASADNMLLGADLPGKGKEDQIYRSDSEDSLLDLSRDVAELVHSRMEMDRYLREQKEREEASAWSSDTFSESGSDGGGLVIVTMVEEAEDGEGGEEREEGGRAEEEEEEEGEESFADYVRSLGLGSRLSESRSRSVSGGSFGSGEQSLAASSSGRKEPSWVSIPLSVVRALAGVPELEIGDGVLTRPPLDSGLDVRAGGRSIVLSAKSDVESKGLSSDRDVTIRKIRHLFRQGEWQMLLKAIDIVRDLKLWMSRAILSDMLVLLRTHDSWIVRRKLIEVLETRGFRDDAVVYELVHARVYDPNAKVRDAARRALTTGLSIRPERARKAASRAIAQELKEATSEFLMSSPSKKGERDLPELLMRVPLELKDDPEVGNSLSSLVVFNRRLTSIRKLIAEHTAITAATGGGGGSRKRTSSLCSQLFLLFLPSCLWGKRAWVWVWRKRVWVMVWVWVTRAWVMRAMRAWVTLMWVIRVTMALGTTWVMLLLTRMWVMLLLTTMWMMLLLTRMWMMLLLITTWMMLLLTTTRVMLLLLLITTRMMLLLITTWVTRAMV